MKVMQETSETASYGIVILLDALGVSSYDLGQSRRFLDGRDWVIDQLESLREFMSTLESGLPGPVIRTFGDSILFTWNVGNDRVMKSLWPVADWLQKSLYLGLFRGLALRGAVSVGEYLESENTVLGPAIADAAAWYEQADWFGAMLTPSLKYHLVTAIDSPGLSDMQYERWFVEYDMPLKGGVTKKHWVIAWPYLVYASSKPPTPRATLATILWDFPKPKGTETKYENAYRFFEWYGQEVFPRVDGRKTSKKGLVQIRVTNGLGVDI